jgi:CRP-like cAMP-binding protein
VKKDAHIELLRRVWLFERCTNKELALLASNATPLRVDTGTVLAREGEMGAEFFVIDSGKAVVSRSGVEIGVLESGSFFGEMALLDRQARVATVTASEPTDLLVMTARAFTSVVDTMPSVDRKMLTVLATRLRELELRYLPKQEQLLART